jgi:uncharacterized protein (TIGR03435 family)
MKRREKNVEEFMLRHLGLFKTPPQPEMDLVETRIQNRLRSAPAADGAAEEFGSRGNSWKLRRLAFVLGAAAAAVIAVVFLQMPRAIDAHAVVESPDGTLSRLSGEKTESVRFGGRIDAGEILRTNDGAAIALADGSRVELRSQSEFSVERGDDGVRIHLRKGSLIVKAAKQVAGRLYVHTRDMVVSVVGTVFLVNAEEEGSHVSVIEGEVRVQHGETTRNLPAGQHFTTNPKREVPPVREEISWSREAEVHVALLQQSAPPAAQPREAFDAVSIRPASPAIVSSAVAGARQGGAAGCLRAGFLASPGRFTALCVTVRDLVDLAYGMKNCPVAPREGPLAALDQGIGRYTYVRSCVSGGPDWAKSDFYEIEATLPAGTPTYSRGEVTARNAPKLQAMIQTMLAERFNLTVRRELREMPVYHLVVEKPGKILLSDDQTPPGEIARGGGPVSVRGGTVNLPRGVLLNCAGNGIEIARLVGCFQAETDRPVIDRTDLKGLYDIPARPVDPNQTGVPQLSTLPLTLEQLGLKLEPARAQLEVLVIERVERPSEN